MKGKNTDYHLILTEDGVPAEFKAQLVKLGNHLFLDTYPGDLDLENSFYEMHLIGAHIFAKMTVGAEKCTYTLLDHEWLEKLLEQKNSIIAHKKLETGIVLTASTSELQNFVLKHADDTLAFPDPVGLFRHQ